MMQRSLRLLVLLVAVATPSTAVAQCPQVPDAWCPASTAGPHPQQTTIDELGDTIEAVGFPFLAEDSWTIDNPLYPGHPITICVAPSLPGDVAALYDYCGTVYLSLATYANSTYPSAKGAASIRATILHEAYHHWFDKVAFNWWLNAICGGLDGQALDDCIDCLSDLINCFFENNQPCFEMLAYQVTIASLCGDLEDPGLSSADAQAIENKIQEACDAIEEATAACIAAGCVNNCGNMMSPPFPPPPNAACECP